MNVTTPSIEPRKVDVITAPDLKPKLQPAQPSIWFCLVPAFASALLLWMSFFPLAWGWLGWVAIVPFLALVRAQATPRRIYLAAWVCGTAFFWPVLTWMQVNAHMYAAWVLLSVWCSLFLPATLWVIRLLDRKTFLPLVVTVPVAWTALEFARSFLLTGFAWYYLGHTQHAFVSMIQIADLGGVYLITFLVAAVNAWLFDGLYQVPNLRDLCRLEEPKRLQGRPIALGLGWRRGWVYEAGLLLIAMVGTLIYGGWRLSQNEFAPGPVVTVLQTNIPTNIRDAFVDGTKRQEALIEMTRQYAQLCKKAIDYHPRTELIIWPETSYTPWYESAPNVPLHRVPAAHREAELSIRTHLTKELLTACPTNHLLGMNAYVIYDETGRPTGHNSAVQMHKNGTFPARYDKMHRVPFGEYVPFRTWPVIGNLMNMIVPYDFDYSIRKGEKYTRFEVDKYKFGVLICYEDTDPLLAPNYVRAGEDGPPVDFLVNISNDGWFDGSSEHDEHLAISRFRAIEARRALVRSVNMGISAVIDGNGRVLSPRELPPPEAPHFWIVDDAAEDLPVTEWAKYKKTPGVLRARVPLDQRVSYYAKTGDVLPPGCWALIGVAACWSWLRNRKRHRGATQVGS